MECACFDMEAEGESATFYNKKIVTARKSHKCCECHREISPCERYEYVSAFWDDFVTFKTCVDCLSIIDAFFCSRVHEGLYENLRESLEGLDGKCLADAILKLTPTALERVQEILKDINNEN